MRAVVAGLVSLVLSLRLWTLDVTVGGGVCGSVHDLWTGRWSPPTGGRDLTAACLDAAVWPQRAADAWTAVAVALLAVGAVLVVRRAWRRSDARSQLAAAGALGAAAGAATFAAALRLDPGPICPYVWLGREYDPREEVVQCLALGGGLELASSVMIAGLVAGVVVVVVAYYLLVARAWHARTDRRGGWASCATS